MNRLQIGVLENHSINKCLTGDYCSMNDDGELSRHTLTSGENDLICFGYPHLYIHRPHKIHIRNVQDLVKQIRDSGDSHSPQQPTIKVITRRLGNSNFRFCFLIERNIEKSIRNNFVCRSTNGKSRPSQSLLSQKSNQSLSCCRAPRTHSLLSVNYSLGIRPSFAVRVRP